jgi:hypothetical protein
MKKIYFRLLLAPAVITLFFAGTNFSGGTPGGKTGSPGDGGSTCTDCHVGTATPAEGWITSDIPTLGYEVGETYTITAEAMEDGVSKFGFELTAEDASGNKVGTFAVVNSETQLANSNASVTHTSSGTSGTNSKTWTMEWTAPATDIGVVTFYGAFNATNGNGATSGDMVFTSMLSVDESSVGFGKELAVADFTFGPNPSFGSIQVSHPYDVAQVSIFDISGKTVLNIKNYTADNTIDLGNLNSGIYFIQLQHENAIKSQKLVLK